MFFSAVPKLIQTHKRRGGRDWEGKKEKIEAKRKGSRGGQRRIG